MKKLYILNLPSKIYLVLILTFLLQSGFAQENLIVNGDFENGTTGWTVWGATMASTTDFHSGKSAAIISNRKNSWDAVVVNLKNILKNGQNYTLSAWVKIPDPAVNFRATIQLNIDGVTTYHGFLRTASPVIGSYQLYTENFSLDWTGNLVDANLYFETDGVNGIYSDYIIDDVQLVKYTPPTDIIQTGSGWKDIQSTMLVGGCVTDGSKNYFTNEAAKAQVLRDCNTVTVQCYPAWGRWDETKKHVYHVDDFTSKVKEMKKQNMTVTAHMLLGWDQYFPEWYRKGDFPADTLEAIMQSWLKGIISYQGNDSLVDIWNVVNESISWDGKGGYWPLFNANYNDACELQRMGFEPDASGLSGKQFVNAEHPVYIRKAFEYARTLTNKKLELRDSGFEFPGDQKYNAFYQLAVHLKKMNAPVDVIGFQTHIDIEKNYDWEGYAENIKRYRALGYEVNIPEVDVGDSKLDWNDQKAELQKKQYYNLITAAIRGGASDFQTWGFIDNETGWRGGQNAFPYTHYFEEKPAYAGIMEALTDMSSILFWEMNTVAGDTMPDVMKYNNFGKLRNFDSPVFVPGFKNSALQFDGVDDYISTGELTDSINGDFTFSCFFKTSSQKPMSIATFLWGMGIGINASGKLYFNGADTNDGENIMETSVVNDDVWHFLAIQRDSTTYSLYIDDNKPVSVGHGQINGFNNIMIGINPDGKEPFEGFIDEVRLYKSAIEEESFKRNYLQENQVNLGYIYNGMRVKLSWTDKTNEKVGFVIERKIGDGEWDLAAEVNTDFSYYIENLEFYDTTYLYRIRPLSRFANSGTSNEVQFHTPKNPSTGVVDVHSALPVKVFPNPVHDKITLLNSENLNIKILNLQGETMIEKRNCSASEMLDLANLPAGIYFLRTSDLVQTSVIKLIKID